MKLATFQVDGTVHHGVLRGAQGAETILDLGAGDLLSLIEGGAGALRAAEEAAGPEYSLSSVRLLAPLLRPPKVLCVGANYQSHIRESSQPPLNKQRRVPMLFCKLANAILGPDQPLTLPAGISDQIDWELELAVVMGRRCREVSVEQALDNVAGYTIGNDISARTFDLGLDLEDYPGRDWLEWLWGKWLDGFAPIGPYVVTADEVPDPQLLNIRLSVNGKVKQDGNTSDMIYSVAEIISFASRFLTLQPGDIFLTGTPAGVGYATETFLKPGDIMEGSITNLGTLRTPVQVA